MDLGHWEFFAEFDIKEWFGFIYRIKELHTGKEYIGKKQFFFVRRKVVAGKKNRSKKTLESDWKTYTGSSTHLNDAIKQHGIENYQFIIESLHKTKASLSYAEVHRQISEDVLRIKLDNGEKKFYNKCIPGVKFIVPDEMSEENRMKRSDTLKKRYETGPYWKHLLTEEEHQDYLDNYYRGKNHYLYRCMTEDQRTEFIKNNLAGENNPFYGMESPFKGKTLEESFGEERAKEIRENQRLAIENNPPPRGENASFYGKTHTVEQKEKWKTDERRIKRGEENGMYGKPCFYKMDENEIQTWKDNISKATKGKPKTADHAAKIGLGHKGKKKIVRTCPHCDFTGGGGNMIRYHFDNCKKKK